WSKEAWLRKITKPPGSCSKKYRPAVDRLPDSASSSWRSTTRFQVFLQTFD
ncbi:unnamed protein product, partial [Linum tenue]